ncbi:sugar-binding domain-containing protein [Filibacter tadaridae]|uniref:Central glycolytic genes regulator n=1 Tax=Filibacter tadaridae TaxID=2483811 RepID=A0A3P5X6H2_9BACL|nr:sugar-binding domain-containing protein [Filibacter tadaridae]VDC25976.1 Central glycolytic genes regulator [Filibacter tadaridae]
MNEMLDAQRKLVPEMMEIMQRRYRMLKYVKMAGPVGRRPLGEMASLTERETRTMMDSLKMQGLIHVAKEGASITSDGITVLHALEPMMDDWAGRKSIEKKLTELLGIKSVKVVSGNSDTDQTTKNSLGMEAANQFASEIGNGKVVAVTGGSTIASIPPFIEKSNDTKDVLFIAARGGVGKEIGSQANVIAASFAEKCEGKYSTFYYPDTLSEEAHEAFRKEPTVLEMLQLYETTDCVLHGIGNAQRMAAMRNASDNEQKVLQGEGAKGEAFGYYFNRAGKVVHRLRTVGIKMEHLQRIPLIISVAGGQSKAEAILSYMASAPKQTMLVTDEGAANEMLNLQKK